MSVFNPDPEFRTYKVSASSPVTAQVIIGNAQRGGWAMKPSAGAIIKGSDGQAHEIGTGNDLTGTILQVDVTVVDVNPASNRLNAQVIISGGPGGSMTVNQELTDNGDGDVVTFSTLVMFQ